MYLIVNLREIPAQKMIRYILYLLFIFFCLILLLYLHDMDIEQKRNMRKHLIWGEKIIDEYTKTGLIFIKKQSQIRSVSRKSEIK